MPVAPTFQKYEMLSTEPYEVSGRLYVRVRHPKTRNERQVRWYSDKEYTKLYPEIPVVNEVESIYTRPQKDVLGFEKGYITIFKGDEEVHTEWFQESIARYARWWGWYIVSSAEVPSNIPAGLTPIRLDWEKVGNAEGKLNPEPQIKRAVDELLYEEDNSSFIGEIGDRITLTATVVSAIPLTTNFGRSTMYLLDDTDGNHYVWTTAVKNCFLHEGETYKIRATVKEHRIYKNQKQTVLIRCSEVK